MNRYTKVRELVKDPSLTIKDIAQQTGYDKGHVSRLRKASQQSECPRCGHCRQAELYKNMKPKFMQLLEKCILDGVMFGHIRAYKHNPTPERYEINEAIVNEVMNEIHDWFDFDEGKA